MRIAIGTLRGLLGLLADRPAPPTTCAENEGAFRPLLNYSAIDLLLTCHTTGRCAEVEQETSN